MTCTSRRARFRFGRTNNIPPQWCVRYCYFYFFFLYLFRAPSLTRLAPYWTAFCWNPIGFLVRANTSLRAEISAVWVWPFRWMSFNFFFLQSVLSGFNVFCCLNSIQFVFLEFQTDTLRKCMVFLHSKFEISFNIFFLSFESVKCFLNLESVSTLSEV